ncbi:unnamed protein product [Pleuronectes platessa]|uniref:Uncharacterized protein n=1 Tax=Pleuronectes platessa TaxID=8262 RepID=A0A9N7UWF4_PLEPL|nr:unnamed protein product [Pleuronectes platessa]
MDRFGVKPAPVPECAARAWRSLNRYHFTASAASTLRIRGTSGAIPNSWRFLARETGFKKRRTSRQHPRFSGTVLRRSVRAETRLLQLPSLGEDALGMPLEKPLRRIGIPQEAVRRERERERETACVRRCDSVRCSCSTEVLQRSAKERGSKREGGGQEEEREGERERGACTAWEFAADLEAREGPRRRRLFPQGSSLPRGNTSDVEGGLRRGLPCIGFETLHQSPTYRPKKYRSYTDAGHTPTKTKCITGTVVIRSH